MADRDVTVALSLHAMATRFEIVLDGDDPVRLRAAGEAALQEIERLECQLSFYRPDSEITWINARAADGPVRIDPRIFRLLARCADLTSATDGAFDVTIGPLVRAWGFATGTGAVPDPDRLAAARDVVGMEHVELDDENYSIRFKRPGVALDLGGYGKGYAIESAIAILRECGIERALMHGGTSSVFAVGTSPENLPWKIALSDPFGGAGEPAVVELVDEALSVSAVHGKAFTADGRTYGHVIDPRSGEPVNGPPAAAARGPSAADCEALSTALLVLGPEWLPELARRFPGYVGFLPSGRHDAGSSRTSE
jgi:FAD:protein FMN transferase